KGHCVLCAVVAERACQRCGDFYCSQDCQLKDWQRHRYICFPMPALVYPKLFSANLSESTDEQSLEGACFVEKPDKVVVESSCPSPLPGMIPDLECGGAVSKVGSSSAKSVPVTNATIPHTSNSNVSNNNTFKAKNKNVSPPKAIMPPSNSLVFISGFRSPNRCHIRDASEIADKAFAQMCEKVNRMGNEMPIMVKARSHSYCLARYNGMFQRASVMTQTGNHTARLLLFDLGIIKSRNLSEMREINAELLSLPSFSVQVQLKNVPNYAITDDVIEFLSRFEGEKFMVVYTKSPGAIYVELLDPETKKSLNDQICEFCTDKKVFLNPYAANKNQAKEKPPMPQNTNAGLALNKPNTSQESKNINNTIVLEAGKESITPLQECAKIEVEKKLNETKDIAKTDSNSQNDECANESKGGTERAKTTFEIQNLNLSQEPNNANGIPLDKNKNKDRAPSPLSKTNDESPFKMRRLSISGRDGIDVYIVDVSKLSRGIFGAFDCSFASEFSTLHSRLSEITDPEPYKPSIKEFVLARFEGSWYRGRVEKVKVTQKQTEYRVMYLDYTNAADVTEQDIRRYPLDFTTPCTTNICMIDGFPHKPSPAQVAYLSETVKVHQLLHIDDAMYLSIQSDIAIIKSRSLIEKLMSL
ncbi:hypothetical protein KR032_003056, partial [Drosophila birchii]